MNYDRHNRDGETPYFMNYFAYDGIGPGDGYTYLIMPLMCDWTNAKLGYFIAGQDGTSFSQILNGMLLHLSGPALE